MQRTSFLFLLLLTTAPVAADQPLPGPIEAPNFHPLAELHLSISPSSPRIPPAGSTLLRIDGSLSNTVNREPEEFLVDAETRELRLTLSHVVTGGLELGVRQALLYRGSGFTDGPIDDYHELLGLPRGPRKRVEEDSYDITGITDTGDFSLRERGAELSDLDLTAKYELTRGSFDSAIALELRLPTGAKQFGQESVDIGIALHGGADFDLVYASFSLGGIYLGDPTESGLEYEHLRVTGAAYVDLKVTEWFSLVAGAIAESAMLENVPGYPNYQTYLDTGLRIGIGEQGTVEFLIRENPIPDDSTVDITFFLAGRYIF